MAELKTKIGSWTNIASTTLRFAYDEVAIGEAEREIRGGCKVGQALMC